MSSSPKRPWHMFYPLAGMVFLCAIWSGYWYVAFTKAKELAEIQRQELLRKGLQLECANESWSGFPFRFEFQCGAAVLHFSRGEQTIRVRSASILAITQAYNPTHILLLVDGPTLIDKTNTNVATLSHGRALISITFNQAGEWDVSSEIPNANAQGLFSSTSMNFYARQIKDKLDLAANTEKLVVFGFKNPTTPITKAEIIAQTSAAFLNTQSPLVYAASTGTPVEISGLKISTGPVNFDARGQIFLGSDHRLNGKLSSQTNDIDGLLNFISPLVDLNEKDRTAVKSLLGMMGNDPKNTTAKADLAAKDGALYWGPFKLADLQPLY